MLVWTNLMAVEYRADGGVCKGDMLTMIVTEDRLPLEPVTADDFLAGLEAGRPDDEPARAQWEPPVRRKPVPV
jgi:hypothetical protein